MTRWGRVGAALVILGALAAVVGAGVSAETLAALGAGLAVFGAAILLRTIPPGR